MSGTVTLAFPAQTVNAALARTMAAAMAARADLPLDQLEDVRLAVDEAVTQAIATAPDDAEVQLRFDVADGAVDVQISAPTRTGELPATGTFGWTILTALVDSVDASVSAGRLDIRLHVVRSVPVAS